MPQMGKFTRVTPNLRPDSAENLYLINHTILDKKKRKNILPGLRLKQMERKNIPFGPLPLTNQFCVSLKVYQNGNLHLKNGLCAEKF